MDGPTTTSTGARLILIGAIGLCAAVNVVAAARFFATPQLLLFVMIVRLALGRQNRAISANEHQPLSAA